MEQWKRRARDVRRDVRALYLARRDPRIPWYARLFAIAILAYAVSPIDLIPDFIPVLGYLDDLILVPLGLILLIKMLPPHLLDDYRAKAESSEFAIAKNWTAAIIIVGLWICGIALAVWAVHKHFAR